MDSDLLENQGDFERIFDHKLFNLRAFFIAVCSRTAAHELTEKHKVLAQLHTLENFDKAF